MPKTLSQTLSKAILPLILLAFISVQNSWSGELDVDLTGLSYHIGANSENPAQGRALRGLDKHGAFVFNPGAGIGYDFRAQSAQGGLGYYQADLFP